jgi:phosphatidate cytidylyltransferase
MGALTASLSVLLYAGIVAFGDHAAASSWILLMVVALVLLAMTMLVFVESFTGSDAGRLSVAVLYPAIGFASIALLRSEGLLAIGFLFLITVSTDVFAYLIGVRYGKHRLAVKISPKKSIEGSIGGSIAAMLFALLYVLLSSMESFVSVTLTWWSTLLLALAFSVLAQIGDLAASKLKREMGIKDFSNLFPGHGGVMDRFDSALFLGVVVLFLRLVVTLL